MAIPVQSLGQIQEEEAKAAAAKETLASPQPIVVENLSSHILKLWQRAKEAKQIHENQFLANLRARNGQYSPEKLAAMQQMFGADYEPIYMQITASKCRAAESWIRETLFQAGERPFGASPTPIPDLPPELQSKIESEILLKMVGMAQEQAAMQGSATMMGPDGMPVPLAPVAPTIEDIMIQMQEMMPEINKEIDHEIKEKAKEAAEKMVEKIDDQFLEGGWYENLDQAIYDIVTFGTMILKGPCFKKFPSIERKLNPTTGKWESSIKESIQPSWERRSPFNIYPSPDATGIEDGWIFDRLQLTRKALSDLKGVPGYSDAEISAVLQEYRDGGLRDWLSVDTAKAAAEGRDTGSILHSETIECLEYHGTVPGSLLLGWGMRLKEIPDPEREFDVVLWQIGSHVIKAMLNPDPLRRKYFYRAGFSENPDMFWGIGIPQLVKSVADLANSAARAVGHNVAIACLTGDTIVYRHTGATRGYSEITLNELWAKRSDPSGGLKRIKIRSLDESTGEMFQNRIVDIVDNGTAEVFEVLTANGYRIKATMNHRFLSSGGEWQELYKFAEGDMIGVNGSKDKPKTHCVDCGERINLTAKTALRCKPCAGKKRRKPDVVCIECGKVISKSKRNARRCRKCASQYTVWNTAQMIEAAQSRDCRPQTARGRMSCQMHKKNFCEECGRDGGWLEIHHIDKDPWNNSKDNLLTLCGKCHKRVHAICDTFGDGYKHKYLTFDQIISIKEAGAERVFDLVMEGPNHNFVGNGFQNHNSGPQVEINIDRLAPGENTALYPWKVWRTTNAGMQEGRAVEFYQPNPITQRLLEVYRFCMDLADEDSGVPRYMQGNAQGLGGAGETSSGLNMLMTHAAKGVRSVIRNIDNGIIERSVEQIYIYNMQYDDDIEIIGDVRFVAKGSSALVEKGQMAMRRTEILNTTANPFDIGILGVPGRKELIKQNLIAVGIDPEEVLTEDNEQMMQPPLGAPAPASGVGGSQRGSGMMGAPPPAAQATGMDGGPMGGQMVPESQGMRQ